MEKSCESFSHLNSGIRRICWHISMPSSDKPKNETQEKSNAETQRTQRRRRAAAEQWNNARPLPVGLTFVANRCGTTPGSRFRSSWIYLISKAFAPDSIFGMDGFACAVLGVIAVSALLISILQNL
jgi:hypothetical protein